jgi:hypothetical protein
MECFIVGGGMVKSAGSAGGKSTAEALSCGRTLEEQIEWIRKFGNHGASPAMRNGVLAAHGGIQTGILLRRSLST